MMKVFLVVGSISALPVALAFISPNARYGLHFNVGVHETVAVSTSEHNILSTSCSTKLNLFGNLFGNDVADLENKELARFSNLLVGSDMNIDVKFDSLSIMISSWSKMFSDHKNMGLTTAVDVVELPKSDNSAGVQFLFKKGTGGRSAYSDKDDNDDKKKRKEEDTISEGGVQVMINKLSDGDLEVIATRCEVEEGTMIKEMSEQTIIDSLGQVMQAWKKEQK
mmetsp:Transcript_23445/g.33489  ORF Transcript_23445/g.33489 Transcript_23445/m.33489 type:complete len:223 (+) Transcript_23445:42-710(+)